MTAAYSRPLWRKRTPALVRRVLRRRFAYPPRPVVGQRRINPRVLARKFVLTWPGRAGFALSSRGQIGGVGLHIRPLPPRSAFRGANPGFGKSRSYAQIFG